MFFFVGNNIGSQQNLSDIDSMRIEEFSINFCKNSLPDCRHSLFSGNCVRTFFISEFSNANGYGTRRYQNHLTILFLQGCNNIRNMLNSPKVQSSVRKSQRRCADFDDDSPFVRQGTSIIHFALNRIQKYKNLHELMRSVEILAKNI